MLNTDRPVCKRCHKPFTHHIITDELTCFVHGNPDGSPTERAHWDEWEMLHPSHDKYDKVMADADANIFFGL